MENVFYWLSFIHCKYLRSQRFENAEVEEVSVVYLNFFLLLQRSMKCNMENGFYRLVYFHCKFLRSGIFENVVF